MFHINKRIEKGLGLRLLYQNSFSSRKGMINALTMNHHLCVNDMY